ncbi:MAG: flotillin family protein [Christensenellaceae bacterium]|nr:flotillin family protein [Christensenellaceae bacterium]
MVNAMSAGGIVGLILALVFVIGGSMLLFATRYKKCPSDRVLVVYGKVGKAKDGAKASSLCIHGGARLIIPLIQSFAYLELKPISISVDLKNALSRQNIRVDIPSNFTIGISTEPGIMENAAERLLGLPELQIKSLAEDIILGQLRLIVATMEIEEINADRDKFLEAVAWNVETELKKIGLRLINVNVKDISDESGYIDALGREAAAKAINDARRSVAEKNREGAIGEANAQSDQRIKVADADSLAIVGENKAKEAIADANATLMERQAEAKKRAEAATKVQTAKALEEGYEAERVAELKRAEKEKATQEANILVAERTEKARKEISAEAEAERLRRVAKGEADAMFAKLDAQARGGMEILTQQAHGFEALIKAGGNATAAVNLLLADKIEEIARIQAEAIKNIKIDKITVWDSGKGENGNSSTANFVSGLYKSVPPLQDVFKQAGLDVPTFLGSERKE